MNVEGYIAVWYNTVDGMKLKDARLIRISWTLVRRK